MATREGGSNPRPPRFEEEPQPASAFTEGPTSLGAPVGSRTIMGKPAVVPTAADAYFVKRASGAIEGPTPSAGVVGAILAGALGGDETVSKDRKFWIPIMAIPEFGAAFRDATGRGGTVVGAQAPMAPVAPGTPEEQALNTADFSVVRDIAEQARRAAQFGELPRAGGTLSPIGATGLGSVAERASRLATGSWSSNPDDPAAPAMSEASVASIQTNADALGAVSGLRRVSPEGMQPGTGMTGQLPLPKGFTNYPVAFNPESIPGLGGVTDLPRPAGGRSTLRHARNAAIVRDCDTMERRDRCGVRWLAEMDHTFHWPREEARRRCVGRGGPHGRACERDRRRGRNRAGTSEAFNRVTRK